MLPCVENITLAYLMLNTLRQRRIVIENVPRVKHNHMIRLDILKTSNENNETLKKRPLAKRFIDIKRLNKNNSLVVGL